MKKKTVAETVIAPEILAMAKKSAEPERLSVPKRCAVCAASCTALSAPHAGQDEEDLCWVCRRLKISAWREADQQISAQE